MRKVIAIAMVPILLTSPALAAPGVTTSDVNFRAGPGTSYESFGVLATGTAVEIGECDAGGSWCAVAVDGRNGFISGRYLQESEDPNGWPRVYEVGEGRRMVLYQPQFTEWTDFETLDALIAAEYIESDTANPVFGVIGVTGSTSYDEAAGDIVVSGITVTEFNFSGLDRGELGALAIEANKLLPTGPITIAETRVAASLAEQARMVDVEGLKADPPPILFSTTPAILVQTDGEPAFAPVKGAPGLSFVINTNWDILRVDEGGALYLRDDTHWLTAGALAGDWTAVTELPEAIRKLPDDESWADARAAMPPEPYPDGAMPKAITTATPAELLIFDGEPELVDVPGTGLRWASNTESDVFFHTAEAQWYVLLSGRWFRAAALEGPWTFATPDLPPDFQNIPEDAPYYAVRASVPGTSESAEARLKASIPATARVEAGAITPEVAYAGEPDFVPIDSTELAYASNTGDVVIRVGDSYFLLQDGVWFVSSAPDGPWELAREVPAAIYDIPPSSPVYNATYVRVYEVEDDAVWYGYTMGYLSGFLAWGTYVYGTGWRYDPYWYRGPGYAYPIYYPRPVTWGIGAYYNPVRGMYGRYGYAYGPYRGIAGARRYNPVTGTYARAGAAWGPRGTAGFVGAYNPRRDAGGYLAGGRNVYGSWQSAGVRRGSDWARVTARENVAGGSALRWNTSEGGQGFVREGRRGDMYAGRDGNIYRNTGDGWQTFDGGWQDVARPDAGDLLGAREGLSGLSPEARDRLQDRGGRPAAEALGIGAAGAAAGQRLADRGAAPAARPAETRRPAEQRQAAPRQAAAQRQAAPSQAVRRQSPAHVQRDARARQVGNQRQVAARQHARQAPARAAPRSTARSMGGRSGGRGRR